MNRFVTLPYSAFIVSGVTSALVVTAVLAFGVPPIILIPAVLITGTAHFELKARATHRFDRHQGP